MCREHKKTDELPEPAFLIEDLLIVVEIKREKDVIDENGQEKVSLESLGTFYESGIEDYLDIWNVGHVDLTKRPAIVVERQNSLCPDSYNGNVVLRENAKTAFHTQFNARVRGFRVPFGLVGTTVLSKLVVSVTLVRLDDSRSFILVDNKKMPNLQPHWNGNGDEYYTNHLPAWGHCRSPFARTGAVLEQVRRRLSVHPF